MVKTKVNTGKTQVPVKSGMSFSFTDFRIQSFVLLLIGFIFYSNSFFNEYALDDGIVIQKNDYVQQGIRGIPKILSTDAYDSFYKQMGAKQQLSGGRYRPLSVVTFAVEQQLFGSKAKVKPADDVAMVRHVLNVLFYIFSVIILLYFLRNFIFKEAPLIAFFTCLIFLIHPIHTEVISNVKSRDEILSFLFIILTFIAVFRYRETKKTGQLFYGLLFYFLALLSKEYAITLLVLIPMLLYIVKGDSFKESLLSTLPYFFIAGLYLLIRFSIVGVGSTAPNTDVLNNPYMFATKPERWATKIEILNHYLKLLFYPTPLSSDYSYNTIPYTNFKNGFVWMSLIIHLSLIATTIILFFKRNIIAFALAFYLLHLVLISNFLMDIGATMGERLVYHSSFGFALIIGISINWCYEKLSAFAKNTDTIFAVLVISGIIFFCERIVIPRNRDWKNDTSLFIADAKTVPNSALVNGNAGKAYIDLSEIPENKAMEKDLINKAIYHLSKSVAIHKKYVNGYLNLGVAYFKLKDYEKAKNNWKIAAEIFPNNPFLKRNFGLLGATYFAEAMKIGGKQPVEAVKFLQKAVEVDPTNVEYWYNLGGACYTAKDFEMAKSAWIKTLELDPTHAQAKQGMMALPMK